MNFRKKSW